MADDSLDDYFASFGPLAVVFGPLDDDSTPYLSLLHLHHERTAKVIELIRESTRQPNAIPGLINLLRDPDWRPNLVGAVAAYFSSSDQINNEIWRAVDAGSWVTPQLAAILSLRDDGFVVRSIARLTNGCPLVRDSDHSIDDPLARHVSQGPAGDCERSAKAAASLFALLNADYAANEQVKGMGMMGDLADLIALDFDDSGDLATSWRERFLQLVTANG
jgi:hypothetical protein